MPATPILKMVKSITQPQIVRICLNSVCWCTVRPHGTESNVVPKVEINNGPPVAAIGISFLGNSSAADRFICTNRCVDRKLGAEASE